MQKGIVREHVTVLVFEVAEDRYGVEASAVQEIVRAVQAMRLPSAPAVVRGVINVRGEIVPLIDLRVRFGLPAAPLSSSEVFVLASSGRRLVAFRADRAQALIKVARDDIAQLSEAVPHARYAAGAAKLPDGVLLLCDLESFLDEAERTTLTEALVARAQAEVAP
jgi:purine-binding chemotaxis protein CheW